MDDVNLESAARRAVTASPVAASAVRLMAALDGPIVSTMLRLAAPTMLVLIVQTLVGVAETYFVSFLGTEALAGVAMVFPVLMLMQMMSNGGFGGGVSSAVARALGSGRTADASALAFHALVLAVVLGGAFSLAAIAGGPPLYRALGGSGGALAAALTYSDIVFLGAVPLWIVALLASALRGSGNVNAPAAVILIGAVALVVLSPSLIFGWGPLPRLGIAGAGIAVASYYVAAAMALIVYLGRPGGAVRLRWARLEWRLFKDILGVGALSAIGTVQSNLTVTLVTGAVGLFGTAAIAGYGVASRLDYLLIPLLFGFGTAIVTMVATNVGAGNAARARRIAWVGAAIGAGVTELIGVAAAVFPGGWVGLFSGDATVHGTGALYLRIVGPFYGLFGLGMMLYFASQGAGRVLWPVLAGTVRLLVAGLIGWAIVALLDGGLGALFVTVAVATALYGAMAAAAVLLTPWGGGTRTHATPRRLRAPGARRWALGR